MKNIKIKLLTLTILLLSISIIHCFADEIADYPKYFENSNLIPILRGRNFELEERDYSPYFFKETDVIKEINNEVYYVYVKDNIYYYYNNKEHTNSYRDKPNYARAKSVEQTIKQRVKKEKRKLTNKEKKVLKKIQDYMQNDISEYDLLYRQDKKEYYKRIEEEKRKDAQRLGLELLGIIFTIVCLFICVVIYDYKFRKTKEKEENERKKKITAKKDFLNFFYFKKYSAAISCIEQYYLYGDFFNNEKVAYCYCMTGRYKQAINIYNRLLQTKPDNTEYKFNLALAKYKLNSTDIKYLEELYNKEKPFVILKEKMNLKFDDIEQQEAMVIKRIQNEIRKPYEIGNVFGTYNKY